MKRYQKRNRDILLDLSRKMLKNYRRTVLSASRVYGSNYLYQLKYPGEPDKYLFIEAHEYSSHSSFFTIYIENKEDQEDYALGIMGPEKVNNIIKDFETLLGLRGSYEKV